MALVDLIETIERCNACNHSFLLTDIEGRKLYRCCKCGATDTEDAFWTKGRDGKWHTLCRCHELRIPECPRLNPKRYGVHVTQYTPNNQKESRMLDTRVDNNFSVMPIAQVMAGQRLGLEESRLQVLRDIRELELAHTELTRRLGVLDDEISEITGLLTTED